ncbi:Polyphosphate kinase [Chromobacterium violaceum]|uniref:Polyphosphate kinase n=1 Tax=Chromobacterium violaceum TaxID=536 RepID=A0A447THS0_CHRVL|nr:Polyphosphate kinase [Chromobacterium violaceum]
MFYFYNDHKEDLLMSSADWMGRNFFRRIETCAPILDNKLKRRIIKEALRLYLEDNVNSWEMLPDGGYKRRTSRGKPHCAQRELLASYTGNPEAE